MELPRLTSETHMDPETQACYLFVSNIPEDTGRPHCHEFFEFMLVVHGKAFHHINGKKQLMSDGSLLLIRPDDTHCFSRTEGETCQFIVIAFPIETLYEVAGFLGEGFPLEKLLAAPAPPTVKLPTIDKKILMQRLERINLMPVTRKQAMKMELRALLIHLLTHYITAQLPSNSDPMPGWLQQLCSAMGKKENFTRGITAMKELSGKSHEHLCRLFKQYCQDTPTNYINDLKLNYAANLLSNSDLSILELSMEAGFETLSRFYYLFRKKFGITPADFRQQTQKGTIV